MLHAKGCCAMTIFYSPAHDKLNLMSHLLRYPHLHCPRLLRYLLLPIFLTHLILSTTPSLFLLFSAKLLPYRAILISALFFIFVTINLLVSLSAITRELPLNPKINLITQKAYLEGWLKKQPTHRDILLNLSKIDQGLENDQQTQEYKNKAQSLDPNHKIFKEN